MLKVIHLQRDLDGNVIGAAEYTDMSQFYVVYDNGKGLRVNVPICDIRTVSPDAEVKELERKPRPDGGSVSRGDSYQLGPHPYSRYCGCEGYRAHAKRIIG